MYVRSKDVYMNTTVFASDAIDIDPDPVGARGVAPTNTVVGIPGPMKEAQPLADITKPHVKIR